MVGDLDLAIRIRADASRASGQVRRLDQNVKRLGNESQRAATRTNRLDAAWNRVGDRMTRASRAANSLRTAIAGAAAIGVITSIVRTGIEFDRLQLRMETVAGSAASAGLEMEYVRATAERLGIDLLSAARGYSRLSAAARGTALEGQQTRDLFEGISTAAAGLGLSADNVQGIFFAIEQIVSKGVVTMEELRRQLGDRIPGAFQIASRAMNLTTRELNDLVETGDLLAVDFLPAFGRQLREEFGDALESETRRGIVAFARLGNAIRDLKDAIANSGLVDLIASISEGLTGAIRSFETFRNSLETIDIHRINTLLQIRDLDATDLGRFGLDNDEVDQQLRDILARVRAAGDRIPTALLEAIEASGANVNTGLIAPLRVPIGPPADPREAAEEGAGDKLVALRRRTEDRLARLTQERIDLVDRAERQRLARLDELAAEELDAANDDAGLRAKIIEDQEAAATAIIAAAARERRDILEELFKERTERAAEAAQQAADAFASLEGREADLDLGSSFDRAVTEAQRWRDETLAALDSTADGYDQLKDRVEAVYDALTDAALESARAQARAARGGIGGVEQAVEDYVSHATDAFSRAQEAAERSFRGAEDALVDFVTTGKFGFRDLVDSIVSDLARLAIQQQITGPIFNALGGLFGGGGGAAPSGLGFGIRHGGGLAGGPGRTRSGVNPLVFAGAPRLHFGGIAGDEVPTILRRGEGVFTPAQMEALGGGQGPRELRVNITNPPGTELEAKEARATFDPEAYTISIVLDNIATGGELSSVISQIARQGGR